MPPGTPARQKGRWIFHRPFFGGEPVATLPSYSDDDFSLDVSFSKIPERFGPF